MKYCKSCHAVMPEDSANQSLPRIERLLKYHGVDAPMVKQVARVTAVALCGRGENVVTVDEGTCLELKGYRSELVSILFDSAQAPEPKVLDYRPPDLVGGTLKRPHRFSWARGGPRYNFRRRSIISCRSSCCLAWFPASGFSTFRNESICP